MVGGHAEIGKKELLSTRVLASAAWLSRDENGVDIVQCFGIVRFQNPALLAGVVLVKDSQFDGLLLIRSPPAPGMDRAGVLKARLGIQIVRAKDQEVGGSTTARVDSCQKQYYRKAKTSRLPFPPAGGAFFVRVGYGEPDRQSFVRIQMDR